MLNWAVMFLVIAIIAAVFGFTGIAGVSTQIAWVLFVVFIVLFVASLILGRRSPPMRVALLGWFFDSVSPTV